jgi:hypothetical protein
VNHGEIVSFLWGVADLIRDTFKRGKYQDVILPLTVLRRIDCVLAPTKTAVLRRQAELKATKLADHDKQLQRASGFAFYNTSLDDFDKLVGDAPGVAKNLRNYIAGFSQNMRKVVERFDFDNTITKLNDGGLLFQVVERFKNVNLHPDVVDNPTMGTIFEELIRRFDEALDENPWRTLHAARGRPPDGRPDACRRRARVAREGKGALDLRPVLRLRRHPYAFYTRARVIGPFSVAASLANPESRIPNPESRIPSPESLDSERGGELPDVGEALD